MDNLILLCRHHHRLVHEGGFSVVTATDGDISFTDPRSRIIPTGPETRSRGNVFALMATNQQFGIRITPRTGECRWLGESMDYSMAIEGIIKLE